MLQVDSLSELIKGFKARDRRALAKAITIIESQALSARRDSIRLLQELVVEEKKTIRLAISGPPGVGKSTFINSLGQHLIDQHFLVAILAIDPSSDLTMGSLLADKTRMKDLASNPQVYIRPSPSKGNLGGVALATFDVILLVEAFGFDFVIIETVGVGQSETIAKYLADHFLVLLQPGAGDHLQAMKKGIVEKADFILVNKADQELQTLAKKTKASLSGLKSKNGDDKIPYINTVSALTHEGIDPFLSFLLKRHEDLVLNGEITSLRKENLKRFFDYSFDQIVGPRLRSLSFIQSKRQEILRKESEKTLSRSILNLMDELDDLLSKTLT